MLMFKMHVFLQNVYGNLTPNGSNKEGGLWEGIESQELKRGDSIEFSCYFCPAL